MAEVFVYDPRDCIVTVNGQYITGFSEDGKIEIEKNEDNIAHKVGVDGIVSFGVSADGTATATVKLVSTSPSIPLFRELSKTNRLFDLSIVDMNENQDNIASGDCVIVKPMTEYRGNKEVEDVEIEILIPYYEDRRYK